MVTLASLLLISWPLGVWASVDPDYDCRPALKCWPSSKEWQKFNTTIGGHLYETIPIAAPCYNNEVCGVDG